MVKRIVVGFDGSDESRQARWAVELARLTQARVDLVAVAQPPQVGDDVESAHFIERLRAHFKRLLDDMKEELALGDGRIATHVFVGHPAERLVRYAEEHQADHLVVGHRNRGPVQRWFTGSVARQIMDHAPCSVTIVR